MSEEILVCFAVKEEASPFQKRTEGKSGVRILVTGMGRRNAENAIGAALAVRKPGLVLSCGFAGGLQPELRAGQIIFSTNVTALEAVVSSQGAKRARFHCASRVAATAEEKRLLWRETSADAVEMESGVICNVCEQKHVPCAIVRVVLDAAQQDLPLDFNRVMTDEQKMDYFKLALALAQAPGKIPALLRFQKQARAAAEGLAEALEKLIVRL